MEKKTAKKVKVIKDKKGKPIGISIDAKRRKNPKNIDEAFANVFSNFMN